ncbi:embryonic polarity protein dorsal-like isoform X2 [Anoplophora glabripennis]|uniref:embryonic polarity protein dorsal-like isoform X2 n=1 Tax=Anoplophora glabripennis TaxID=217634 RepID=UPI0008754611|nr:embryonic polarity protein dorsal-like isoform X2 [Anoplophora glabripennis]
MDENNLDNAIQNDEATRDSSNLLSDVIEVIATDPDFRESNNSQQSNTMFNGGGEISQQQQQPALQPPSAAQQPRRQPYVRIIEQPASKALRFRYECEGRSAGSIPGASSTPENKTFPTIQIVGHQGRAVVVVSCVTKDAPHRPHPHNIVGRENCRNGLYKIECDASSFIQLSNLGVQCVTRRKMEESLKIRQLLKVDPFNTGFGHRNQPTSIDLNAVRLCFQVFLEGNTPGKFSVPLPAVVSEPIYDKKAMSDLSIIKLSDCVSFVDGGRKDIILLCEKVAKEDIQVRFYEEKGDWEAFADFQPSQVHKQHAIWFRTPRYKTLEVTEPVKVFIQLRRPSDGATSEPLPFELLPLDSEPGILKRKRQKIDDPSLILKHLQDADSKGRFSMNMMDKIKSEPRDSTPSPYGGLNPYGGISPGYVPNLSPQSYIAQGPTPSPPEYQYNIPTNNSNMSEGSPQPLWNSPSTSIGIAGALQNPVWNITSPISNAVPQSENLLFDLDNRVNINSDELDATLKTMDVESTPLPEIENLSFSDIPPNQDQNMTDSLTRLANNTLDSICQLNNMYPPQ